MASDEPLDAILSREQTGEAQPIGAVRCRARPGMWSDACASSRWTRTTSIRRAAGRLRSADAPRLILHKTCEKRLAIRTGCAHHRFSRARNVLPERHFVCGWYVRRLAQHSGAAFRGRGKGSRGRGCAGRPPLARRVVRCKTAIASDSPARRAATAAGGRSGFRRRLSGTKWTAADGMPPLPDRRTCRGGRGRGGAWRWRRTRCDACLFFFRRPTAAARPGTAASFLVRGGTRATIGGRLRGALCSRGRVFAQVWTR